MTSPQKTTTKSVATKDGILFVSTTQPGGQPEFAGDATYADLVAETINLAARAGEPRLKVVLSQVCIEVHKQTSTTIAVVYLQGRPIVKSLQRMVRQLARPSSTTPTLTEQETVHAV